jgi:hypothetical protein
MWIRTLVARDGPQPRELRCDDARGEMHVVVGFHAHFGARKAGLDERRDALGVHDLIHGGLIHGCESRAL